MKNLTIVLLVFVVLLGAFVLLNFIEEVDAVKVYGKPLGEYSMKGGKVKCVVYLHRGETRVGDNVHRGNHIRVYEVDESKPGKIGKPKGKPISITDPELTKKLEKLVGEKNAKKNNGKDKRAKM